MPNFNKILGPIYVGGYEDVDKFYYGDVLFVHHDVQWYSRGKHIPLLKKRPNSDVDRTGAEVNEANLGLIISTIENHFKNNLPLLVHCRGGVERSPLCVVAWLRRCHDRSIDDAYDYVMMKRPVIEDRRYWLGEDLING